ncbi:MAG TPA: hypothetical protein ENK16_02580 [Chromatiales bacterium]|nr:hypothetical protein [Chromatiales bacterium]
MKKIILALLLLGAASAASAVQVVLVSFNETTGTGDIRTRITNGPPFFVNPANYAPPSSVTWDWDGTTLSGTGFFGSTITFGSGSLPSVMADHIYDLSIDTSTRTATATSYECVEGIFLAQVGFNGCGDYGLGSNTIDESTTIWSGLSVSQTIGGDDVAGTIGPRTISAYNYGLDGIVGVNGLTLGDQILIGNGIPLGTPGGELMTFQVVPIPAAVWLFGSALFASLGWMRRKIP